MRNSSGEAGPAAILRKRWSGHGDGKDKG